MKECRVDLWYPRVDTERTDDKPQAAIVGLMDVRAADDIRITYDFDRDGYVIQQVPLTGTEYDFQEGEWTEVAFVPAWQLDARTPEE